MKKIVILTLLVCLLLVGCGGQAEPETPAPGGEPPGGWREGGVPRPRRNLALLHVEKL